MAVVSFTIGLDKPEEIFRPGDVVSGGVLVFISDKPMINDGVEIRFWGQEQTAWEEKTRIRGKKVRYTGATKIFDICTHLSGGEDHCIPIPIGYNKYPFSFRIPSRHMPSSCAFQDGNVSYRLQALIHLPGQNVSSEVAEVNVMCPYRLDSIPGIHNSAQCTEVKVFGSCFNICKSEPCILESYTPKLGYSSGEVITFTLEIFNGSSNTIFEMKAFIIQEWTFRAYHAGNLAKRKHICILSERQRLGVIKSGESSIWTIHFVTPVDAPFTTDKQFRNLVYVDYYIKVLV